MAELLFITPQEIARTTIVGGNVEADKYSFCIFNVQITYIQPMLGDDLYNKIVSDLEGDTLTGDYETLFNEYIKPITKYYAVAEYLDISNYVSVNKGLLKPTSENSTTPERREVDMVAGKYRSLGQAFVVRFEHWISENNLPEWNKCEATDIQQSFGWYVKEDYRSRYPYDNNDKYPWWK